MIRQTGQRGFMLLLTLVLVLLAGVALAGLARQSMVAALDTSSAVENLQRRWAVTTLRAALLERAEKLLDSAERGTDPNGAPAETYQNAPHRALWLRCRLAELDYDVVVTDEQARWNVNSALEDLSPVEAGSAVRDLVAATATRRVGSIRLRPLPAGTADKKSKLARIGGYGQIFPGVPPAKLLGTERRGGIASAVTCWGDGTVNVRRALPETLREACERHVGPRAVDALIEARDQAPYASLGEMLRKAELGKDARRDLAERLTDTSRCHGLWIVTRGRRRSWHAFAVVRTKGDARDPAREFEW